MSDINGSQGRVGSNTNLEEAASNWFAVMQSEACTARDADEFKHWYDADLSHQKAYQDLKKLWELSGGYADKPEIQALREEVLRKTATSKSKSRLPLLSFALAAILIAGFLIAIL
ncbi:MAG: hypothetical protein COB54_06760 [Alphaproteobacteria bacterium]|nr:MAG: hypothetical protein COB54_06760 [Alphaproteobacteria bacterium]